MGERNRATTPAEANFEGHVLHLRDRKHRRRFEEVPKTQEATDRGAIARHGSGPMSRGDG